MAQISRKELKSDEFVSGMDAAFEFILQHRERFITLAVVVAVVAAAGWGVFSWRSRRNQAAAALLAQGLTTLHAPLLTAATPAGVASYASTEARAVAAGRQFEAVIAQYGSTPSGQLARYYRGLAQVDAKNPEAEKSLQAAAASSDTTVSTAAKHALANLDIQLNKPAEAHALLLELTRQDSPTLPRAVALMELADLDRDYNPKEAAQYYRQLQTDYPATATAEQAQQQLATLKQP
ncbi:MAG: tetratricopeptide repeat protein [Terriglobales bacterium]